VIVDGPVRVGAQACCLSKRLSIPFCETKYFAGLQSRTYSLKRIITLSFAEGLLSILSRVLVTSNAGSGLDELFYLLHIRNTSN
jgi:hypothetical protein